MTLYMPPLLSKKRTGNATGVGLQATRRVFGNYDENATATGSHYNTIFQGERHPSQPEPRVSSSTRHNKPHPEGVGFLLQDCATLHEPICDVKTKGDPHDTHWWPSRSNQETNKNPVYSKHTTTRNDFKRYMDRPKGLTRHGCNPNKTAAQGPVPVTHLPNPNGPRLLVEHISYQHGYDSRKTNNQPQRGKLHGNFVWDVLHPTAQPISNSDNHVAGPRIILPGRGSQGMRYIMTHDLIAEPNQEIGHNGFPGNRKPLKPIAGKIGQRQPSVVRTHVEDEGVKTDTLPPLPPIAPWE